MAFSGLVPGVVSNSCSAVISVTWRVLPLPKTTISSPSLSAIWLTAGFCASSAASAGAASAVRAVAASRRSVVARYVMVMSPQCSIERCRGIGGAM